MRDPVHNLIQFNKSEFDQLLWDVIQTQPFQRLRRIRQLGFSEFVFPGATHTRFSHSVGVLHVARQLLTVIQEQLDQRYDTLKALTATLAALTHDVGHGMFSHAFEEIGKDLGLSLARHELVSDRLILGSEISEVVNRWQPGLAKEVADMVRAEKASSLYGAVVSSQFDADRLDYMQRDRMMTGIQSSGVDATWLMSNLEIATVPIGTEDKQIGSVQTLVLGPKAFHVAQSYVMALFELYPNVYLHKTTRAAEKLFSDLFGRIIFLSRDGSAERIGLSLKHPIVKFCQNPDNLENVQLLDDAVFWGALPRLTESDDPLVKRRAIQLRERKLPKCIDIRQRVDELFPLPGNSDQQSRSQRNKEMSVLCTNILSSVKEWAKSRPQDEPRVFVDSARRKPYKKVEESHSVLNQILIRIGERAPIDMAEISEVVASVQTFEVARVYVERDDSVGLDKVANIMRTTLSGGLHHVW